ncbi:porin [Sedimenticola sp.]|uniref:porin n=1 Tax=Sedimenticola sp. TaxID=1940285 RepID=UPI003D097A53
MKKLALALAVSTAVFAQASNAATIYEKNGLSFKMKGDWQIQLRDNASKSKDLDVEFDDLEIKNTITYDLGDDLQAFGQLDFSFDSAAENKQSGDKLEEAYLGVKSGGIAFRVGKMNTSGDEFGIEAAYEKPAGMHEDQFEANKDAGDDVLRVDAEFGNVFVSASHEIEAKGSTSQGDSATDLFIRANFNALSVAAAYQTYDNNADSWGVSATYDAGFAKLGADYSISDIDGSNLDESTLNLVAKFKASQNTSLALGYVSVDDDVNRQDAWYANATYRLPAQKNISLFAEISDSDAGDEMDVLTGVQIKF